MADDVADDMDAEIAANVDMTSSQPICEIGP
jgi:hypothetical protein